MAKDTKFTASFEGKIVGTRRSPRPYLFAIVVQWNAESHRADAYGYKATATDRSNFDYYSKCATGTYTDTFRTGKTFTNKIEGAELAAAQAKIEGGFDAYVARLRAEAIERFEASLKGGYFEPGVVAWSMSSVNAEKTANKFRTAGVFRAIVPAVAG